MEKNSYGIVRVHAGAMRCHMCTRSPTQCGHIKFLQEYIRAGAGDGLAEVEEALKGGAAFPDVRKKAHSTQIIPFHIPDNKRVPACHTFSDISHHM